MSDLKGFRERLALLVTAASRVLNNGEMVELLVFMSEGAEANLKALSGVDQQIAEARALYHEAATIALDDELDKVSKI